MEKLDLHGGSLKNSQSKPYFVYYLYYEDGTLADIGRSNDPEWRMRGKQRKHGCKFTMKVSSPMSFEAACSFETTEQIRYEPPLMKRIVSSPGMYGKKRPHTKEHIEAIVAGRIGYTHSDQTRSKIGDANRGNRHTAETRAEMSRTRRGRKNTEESKAGMSDSAYVRWNRQHLFQSGYGHPWRLQGLDERTRLQIV